MNESRRRRPWLLAVVLTLELAAFLPALGQAGIMRAPVAKASEGTSAIYPWRVFWRDEVAAGRAPLWNPFVFAGMPAAGEPQMQTFYPPNVLWLWMNAEAAFKFTLILHVLLGTLLMYGLVRELGASEFGAAIGALVFGLHGQMIVFMFGGWAQVVAPMAWAPGVLWMLMRAFQPGLRGRRAIAFGGAMLGMQLLSGHPEWARYTLLGGGLIVLFASHVSTLRRRLAIGATMLALGVLIGAPQLFPAIEAAARSSRGQQAMSAGPSLHGNGLPALTLPTIVVPRLFGPWDLNVSTDGFVHKARGAGVSFGESLIYIGLLPLALAAIAVRRNSTNARPWIVIAVVGLLFALNDITHLQCVFDWLVPPDAVFRSPARFVFMTNLGLAALAGLGASRIESGGALAKRALAIAGAAAGMLFAGAAIILALRSRIAGMILDRVRIPDGATWLADWAVAEAATQIAIAGLLIVASGVVLRWFARAPGTLRAIAVLSMVALDLGSASRPFLTSIVRVEEVYAADEAALAPLAGVTGARFLEASPGLLNAGPNVAAISRVRALSGSDLFMLPEWERMDRAAATREPAALDVMGVTHLLTAASSGERTVVPLQTARGRAWWTDGDAEALPLDRAPAARADAAVQIERDLPGDFSARVAAPAEGWLVITEVFYPGWQARVNGREIAVRRAFGSMQAVRVPAGSSIVELRYRPASVAWGAAACGFGLLLIAGLLLVRRERMFR